MYVCMYVRATIMSDAKAYLLSYKAFPACESQKRATQESQSCTQKKKEMQKSCMNMQKLQFKYDALLVYRNDHCLSKENKF